MESKVVGGLFVALSLVILFFIIPLEVDNSGSGFGVGPDFIPILATIIILISSLGILVFGKSNFTGKNAPSSIIWSQFKIKLPKLLITLLGTLLFCFLLNPFGFIISSIVGLSVILLAYREKHIGSYIIGILILVGLGFAMKYGLDMYLPIWGGLT